ncbi:MAG: Holliday junction resolvase-like protein [Chloroflexota bacterium]|nr:Holliday junction resolvase-like protein [Chloroflexota bacterium]MQF66535.1 endonuclease [SAR202 cluster bacterium AC-647-P02_OGT_505m]
MSFIDSVPLMWWFVIVETFVIVLLVIVLKRALGGLSREGSLRRSESTRYGQITEQFMPFISDYPYDSKQFRFLGSPIDGVQFEEDKIVMIEFKSAGSQLSTRQRRIRNLVREGKVDFQEIRVS